MSPGFFYYFELVSFSIFAVEYALRLWSCTEDPAYAHPVKGRLRFAMQPLMIADAVAVISYFILFALPAGMDLGVLRALRLVSRFALLARYSSGLQALYAALSSRRNEMLGVVSVVAALLVLASSLMYYIEQSAQPDKFSSIPATMWWEYHNRNDRGLRRRGAHHTLGASARGDHRPARHRHLRPASGHPGIGVHGTGEPPTRAGHNTLPPVRLRPDWPANPPRLNRGSRLMESRTVSCWQGHPATTAIPPDRIGVDSDTPMA